MVHGFSSFVKNPEEEKEDEANLANLEALIPIGKYKVPQSVPNSEVSDYKDVLAEVRRQVVEITVQGEKEMMVAKNRGLTGPVMKN